MSNIINGYEIKFMANLQYANLKDAIIVKG